MIKLKACNADLFPWLQKCCLHWVSFFILCIAEINNPTKHFWPTLTSQYMDFQNKYHKECLN